MNELQDKEQLPYLNSISSVTVHSNCDQQRISPFQIAFGDGRDAVQDKTCILRANQRSD